MTPHDLRAFLARMGWTQRQASQEFGIAHSTLGHWLGGRRRIPPWVDRWQERFYRLPDSILPVTGPDNQAGET